MTLMAKKTPPRTFNDVLALLGSQRFDVAPARTVQSARQSFQVRKYGCAAEIAACSGWHVEVLARPGWLLGGEIARLVDRGYQKFLKTSKLEIPATADHLRAIHEFSERAERGERRTSLYNEALGTTSDVYNYDRVEGRE